MAIDQNLEIIIDEEGELMAFRHDVPEDMRGMVYNTVYKRYHQTE